MKIEEVRSLVVSLKQHFPDVPTDAEQRAAEFIQNSLGEISEDNFSFYKFVQMLMFIISADPDGTMKTDDYGLSGYSEEILALQKKMEECRFRMNEYQRENLILREELRKLREENMMPKTNFNAAPYSPNAITNAIRPVAPTSSKPLTNNVKSYISSLLSLVETLSAERHFLYRHLVDMLDSGRNINVFLKNRRQIEGTLGCIFLSLKEHRWNTPTLESAGDSQYSRTFFIILSILTWLLGIASVLLAREYAGYMSFIGPWNHPVSF